MVGVVKPKLTNTGPMKTLIVVLKPSSAGLAGDADDFVALPVVVLAAAAAIVAVGDVAVVVQYSDEWLSAYLLTRAFLYLLL